MDTSVKASCNWTLTGGCELAKVIQTKITNEDVFIKLEIEEILSEDHAILLSQPTSTLDPCEFQIRVFPRFKIDSLTMVCSAAKAEIFVGPQKEYTETFYGSFIDDEEDDSNPDVQIHSYRYDVEINKSGVIEVMIKLLTHTKEICIYGIVMNIAPNPNGITTLLPNAINLENVQQMLNNSNKQLSPSAEKCKMFMQMYKSVKNVNTAHQSNEGLESMLQQLKIMMPTSNTSEKLTTRSLDSKAQLDESSTENINETSNTRNFLNDIRAYIDERFETFETKILTRLNIFEADQSAKLDKILKLLEDKV